MKVKQNYKANQIGKYKNFVKQVVKQKVKLEAEPQQNRTVNLLIKSQLLCQLS